MFGKIIKHGVYNNHHIKSNILLYQNKQDNYFVIDKRMLDSRLRLFEHEKLRGTYIIFCLSKKLYIRKIIISVKLFI